MMRFRGLLLAAGLGAGLAWAGGLLLAGSGDEAPAIVIERVTSTLRDGVYYLDADIDYRFGPDVLEALSSGVPVTVELRIEIRAPREMLWDETVAELSQRYRISYHALSDQYLVANLNSRASRSYPSLRAALRAMGHILDLPVVDARLLDPGRHYLGRMKAHILLGSLPAPLRLWALLSREWRIDSGWYTWTVQ